MAATQRTAHESGKRVLILFSQYAGIKVSAVGATRPCDIDSRFFRPIENTCKRCPIAQSRGNISGV